MYFRKQSQMRIAEIKVVKTRNLKDQNMYATPIFHTSLSVWNDSAKTQLSFASLKVTIEKICVKNVFSRWWMYITTE